MILGESGTGKSASLRNFKPGEVAIINVAGKPLPFASPLKTYDTDEYSKVERAMVGAIKQGIRAIVIDDAQYLMADEFMRNSKITGFQKFTDIAKNYWDLVQIVIRQLPPDAVVYFLSHLERDGEGHEKCKTVGKLLDEKITVEGMFMSEIKRKRGRPFGTFKYDNADDLQAGIDAYFAECDKRQEPYTMAGLAYALNISSRTLRNYADTDIFADEVARARSRVEASIERMLYGRESAQGARFALAANFGWQERQQIDITAHQGAPEVAQLSDDELRKRLLDAAKQVPKLQDGSGGNS